MWLNTDKFLERASNIHSNRYDYSKVEYAGIHKKVSILCREHGEFLQSPACHLNGNGCPTCSTVKSQMTTSIFIDKSMKIHTDKYDYSSVIYERSNKKVSIICKEHGTFCMTPNNHLRGQGCSACYILSLKTRGDSLSDFIFKSNNKHNNEYDYSVVKYQKSNIPVEIICQHHGSFMQRPGDHISGAKCPRCRGNISKKETAWLDSLDIDDKLRQCVLYVSDKKLKVDAYDPTTNTIYEFWGDYWHGNPARFNPTDINKRNKKMFGELYNETQLRSRAILESGYNLVEIWEYDWDRLQNLDAGKMLKLIVRT